MKKIIKTIIAALSFVVFLGTVQLVAAEKVDLPLDKNRGFPVIRITTPENPFVQERTLWQSGTISIENTLEEFAFEAVGTGIRGRGNSTWWNGENKRPLRFRLDEARSLLGSDYEARDWILLADNFDRSLLRNYSALYLGGLLSGMDFVPSVNSVHLYVNGEYMGVYLLTDERDVNPGRMDLTWDPNPAVSGFFLELDARAYQDGGVENETFVNVNGLLYDIRYPGSSGRTPEHVAYVREYLETVSQAIRGGNFDEILALIDLNSFIDFYLVQELFKNADVHSLSVFMHISGEGDSRRLFMGPLWDFDMAAGNFRGQPLGSGPENIYVAVFNYWYRNLMDVPEFFEAVKHRWNEIFVAEIPQTIKHIRDISVRYRDDFERNFERHQIMGIAHVPTPEDILEIMTHEGQVEFLINWLEARALWLDDFFNGRLEDYDPLRALLEYHTDDRRINININGELQELTVPPIMLQSRTMLSLQEIADIFNLTVSYDEESGLALIEKDSIVISHQIGNSYLEIDGQRVHFGAPSSMTINGENFVPLRVIAEILGYEIRWHSGTRTIFLDA